MRKKLLLVLMSLSFTANAENNMLAEIKQNSQKYIKATSEAWQDTKEYANSAMFWKKDHLDNIDFDNIYPKALYNKSYSELLVTGTVVVVAGAATYFTAGAGAPVAATGVSSVATWVAGGGAGSYMAGLSTIGGWFGGNAILGASILNGVSYGIIGGRISTFATLPILAKIDVLASVTATGLDGIVYFFKPDTQRLEYKIKVTIPEDLGSKETRELVNELYNTDKLISAAFEQNNPSDQEKYLNQKLTYSEKTKQLLNKKLQSDDNQEDLIVLSIIAYNNGEYELFDKAISKINVYKLNSTGFLNYLYALQNLYKGNIEKTLFFLDASIYKNKYAIEPIILYMNILGNDNFLKNESKIKSLLKLAEDNYDSDKYTTPYSLTSLYFRAATFYFENQYYSLAQEYYEKAYDSLGILQQHFFSSQLKNIIQLGVANSLYAQHRIDNANLIYQEIIEDIENPNEKNNIQEQYLGNIK